jgi:hypothetical protein
VYLGAVMGAVYDDGEEGGGVNFVLLIKVTL